MSSGESKLAADSMRLSENLDEFISKLKPTDKVAVLGMGRFQPFHLGHKELVCQCLKIADDLKDKVQTSNSFIWISPTNIEERWTENKQIIEYLVKISTIKNPRSKRLVAREKGLTQAHIESLKNKINKTEPLPTDYRIYFLNKILDKVIETGDANCPITDKKLLTILYDRVADIHNPSDGYDNTKKRIKNVFKYDVNNIRGISSTKGQLFSKRCLNWLRSSTAIKDGYNKVILLVGSDRVEAFKKYNNDTIKQLFTDGLIVQSGNDRGSAGKGVAELTELFEKLKITENDDTFAFAEDIYSSMESNMDAAGKYSGSLARNYAVTGGEDTINNFLNQIGYNDDDDVLENVLMMINKIREINGKTKISRDFLQSIITKRENQDLEMSAKISNFVKTGGKRKTRRKRKSKRKRCSKKRLKKKIICYRGTKKKLKKLRKLTKKLKLRLTKCSKKRLKKWKIKKTRKRMK